MTDIIMAVSIYIVDSYVMNNLIKNGVIITCFLMLIAETFVIISFLVVDQKLFNQILSNLNSLGGFIGGCSAAIATVVATTSLNAWVKQTKLAPYLKYIWDAKVTLRLINRENSKLLTLQYNSFLKDNALNKSSKVIADEIAEVRSNLLSLFSELKFHFDCIDQIIEKKEYQWANRANDHRQLCYAVYKHTFDSKDIIQKLDGDFDPELCSQYTDGLHMHSSKLEQHYKQLCSLLDELENKCSK